MAEILAQYPDGFISPLPSMGILSLEGADALPFIHRQLSNDIERLRETEATLAAYCTPQGRVLALFTVWKTDGKVYLALPKDNLPAIQKRLRLYVLRDKVTITDLADSIHIYGMTGPRPLAELGIPSDDNAKPYAKTQPQTGTLIRWPDALGQARWLLISQAPLTIPEKYAADENPWWLADIEAGIPRVNAAIQNQFLPQMLNLEAIGALSFTKGCYPGQEIVSRAQFRGAVRSALFKGTYTTTDKAQGVLPDGTALSNASGENCGTVVMSAINGNTVRLLAVIKLDDAKAGVLHLSQPDGERLTLLPDDESAIKNDTNH